MATIHQLHHHQDLWSSKIVSKLTAVWPDVEMKCCPKFYIISCPKITAAIFDLIEGFKKSPKCHQVVCILLLSNLSPRTFKNRPIWSHWSKVASTSERERKKRKTKAKLKKFPLGIHFSSINLNIFRNCFNKFSKENKLHEKHFVDKDKNLSLNELSKKESSIGIDFTARWG